MSSNKNNYEEDDMRKKKTYVYALPHQKLKLNLSKQSTSPIASKLKPAEEMNQTFNRISSDSTIQTKKEQKRAEFQSQPSKT